MQTFIFIVLGVLIVGLMYLMKSVFNNRLFDAIRAQNPVLVRTLLSVPSYRNSQWPAGLTPLMAAARTGNVEVVDLLLAAGYDVNASNAVGITALMIASRQGHFDVVLQLVEAGADLTKTSHAGSSAASLARKYGHHEIALLLERYSPLTREHRNNREVPIFERPYERTQATQTL